MRNSNSIRSISIFRKAITTAYGISSKLLKKSGWELRKTEYNLNKTNTMEQKNEQSTEQVYHCSECGHEFHKHDVFCPNPNCGKLITYMDYNG